MEIWKSTLLTSSEKDQTMDETCDELRQLLLLIHQIIASKNQSLVDIINPYNHLIRDLSQSVTKTIIYPSEGRGRRLISSSNNYSPLSTCSSRQSLPYHHPSFS